VVGTARGAEGPGARRRRTSGTPMNDSLITRPDLAARKSDIGSIRERIHPVSKKILRPNPVILAHRENLNRTEPTEGGGRGLVWDCMEGGLEALDLRTPLHLFTARRCHLAPPPSEVGP